MGFVANCVTGEVWRRNELNRGAAESAEKLKARRRVRGRGLITRLMPSLRIAHVEIDQQADRQSGELQVGDHLRCVNGREALRFFSSTTTS